MPISSFKSHASFTASLASTSSSNSLVSLSVLHSDLIKALIPQMGLSSNDSAGRPLDYQAFTKNEGIHLRGFETVGDALKSGDEISLLPDIQAG